MRVLLLKQVCMRGEPRHRAYPVYALFLGLAQRLLALLVLLVTYSAFLPPDSLAQSSLSFQAKFITPTILSACNRDTICVDVSNLQGAKGVTYTGNTTLEIDVPGGTKVQYLANSVISRPTGATQVSYASNKLTIAVPMPATGATTRVCFVVSADCSIGSLTTLPRFSGKITYPAGFPIASETFTSARMNTGVPAITLSAFQLNESPPFNATNYNGINVANSGYGNISEVLVTTTRPTVFTNTDVSIRTVNHTNLQVGLVPISSTVVGANTIRVFRVTGTALGADRLLTPGETVLFLDQYTYPQVCATYNSGYKVEYVCANTGNPSSCAPAKTIADRTTVGAGTPRLDATLVSAENPDGCPDKSIVYTVRNNGTGNAAPTGNAYDVDLQIGFGGGVLTINDVRLNGVLVPTANLSPATGPGTSFTIRLKNLMTTDPDGAGGISDLDGDGFFDDMLVAAQTQVSFKYSVPCQLACGANLYYQLRSQATFTDFCRTLNGSTGTNLKNFGFQQVQAIEQTRQVNYPILTAGQSQADTAKFNFQYQALNMDFANAVGELRIKYSKYMEITLASIKLNGVAPTNAPTLQGANTGNPADLDSMVVVTLTSAELAALVNNTGDRLEYIQTYYGCTVRQNTTDSDYWQLVITMKPGLCTDGSTPCTFDLACKKGFVYGKGQACGDGVCVVTALDVYRSTPTGYTAVNQTTPLLADPGRAYAGDTITIEKRFFFTGDLPLDAANKEYELLSDHSIIYNAPAGYVGKSPYVFLNDYSTIEVYRRTPDPANASLTGTIGTKLYELPLKAGDYVFQSGNTDTENTEARGITTNNIPPTGYNNAAYGGRVYDSRYVNTTDPTKFWESYRMDIWRALEERVGFVQTVDDNLYFVVKMKWRLRPEFPWNNTTSHEFKAITFQYTPNGVNGVGACNEATDVALVVSKDHYIANPRAVYSASCGLVASNKVFFKSQQGNYFQNNEVRVPLKIDRVEIQLPSEYAITPGTISLKYNQGCAVQTYANIVTNANTGSITFTNGTGGDFPRADDCSGNTIAYDLGYTLVKTGTAAPAVYRYPIRIFARDEFNKVIILTDSASISEANPNLTLTPLTSPLRNTDGGSCQPAFFDFKLQNNTLWDAPNVYFAAESGTGTTITTIGDHPDSTYADAILPTDINNYGTNNRFAKLGTLQAGDVRIVRVYANTTLCSGQLKVYIDWGCAYPSPLEPVLTSTTLDQTTATYEASEPQLAVSQISSAINVTSLCTDQTIELEIRNTDLPNLFKGVVGLKLPASMRYVAGSGQLQYATVSNPYAVNAAYTNIVNIATVGTDSVRFDLSGNRPFNGCGLPGADTTVLQNVRIRFGVSFVACPTTNLQEIAVTTSAENYCGIRKTVYNTIPVNYVGQSGTQNNYSLSQKNTPINICAGANQVQAVSDIIYIKNIGGYGTLSGASSGKDSVTFSIPGDVSKLTLANFAVGAPFTNPVFGTDVQGSTTIRVLIPSGIAVSDSLALPISYDLTPKVDKICLADATPLICYFAIFSTPVDLGCTTKGLSCTAVGRSLRGSSLSLRSFDCCYGSIGDYVWLDTNNNGQQDGTETGVASVSVVLTDAASGTVVSTTITDGQGKYLFDSLFTGTYRVQFIEPAATVFTSFSTGASATDSDAGINGLSGIIPISTTLAVGNIGRDNLTIDAGIVPAASLGDFVFEDVNANGQQDGADKPIAGVTVSLISSGTLVATTTTNASGNYSFTGLTPGVPYSVSFTAPVGFTATGQNTGTDATDSDGLPATGLTAPVTLTANENNISIDMGYFKPASLGNSVFNDVNRDGQQDGGDLPLAGVTVTLVSNGTVVATTTTNASGSYSFTGLTPGIPYSVSFTTPANFTAASANIGNDATDSDPVGGITAPVTLTSGENNTTLDAGFTALTASLGDSVFEDVNANGQQDGADKPIAGVTVSLLSSGTLVATTTTNASGNYSFTGLTPGVPYSVSFTAPAGFTATGQNTGNDATDSDGLPATGLTAPVTLTANENNISIDMGYFRPASLGDKVFVDVNKDGQQDGGDLPLAGVTVTLVSNGTVVATTTTNASGSYSFTGLTPGIPYSVSFTTPANFTAASANIGNDATDSDPVGGITAPVTLTSGENNTTLDAGFTALTASLGDSVFEDVNANGQQDGADKPIAGVTVSLISSGTLVATTTTNASGNYSFTGLTPGVPYSVSFTAPVGFTATGQNTGNDATDSDGLPATGLTAPVTLTANENNISIDMGYFKPASLGNSVFNDVNRDGQQDGGDLPLAGVTVTLVSNGTVVATTTTNASGTYSFTGLTPGVPYSVSFTTPANFTATTPLAGTNTATDSNPVGGITAPVTLTSGENNTSIDAGFSLLDTPVIQSTTVCAGLPASLTLTGCTGTVQWTGPNITSGASSSVLTVSTAANTAIQQIVSYTASCSTAGSVLVGTVTVNPAVTATISPMNASICAGQTTTLTASGGVSYRWNTGAVTATISVSAAGTYSVTATSAVGCSGTATTTVTVNPLPLLTATSATICAGQATTLTASGASTYLWSNGNNTAQLSVMPLVTTVYSVTGTSAAGCSTVVSGTVTVNGQPQINAITQSTICVGNTASLTVNATNTGVGTLEYSLNNGAFRAANSFTISAATSVTAVIVVRTQGSSCSATESVVVNCACQTPVGLVFVPTTLQTCAGVPVSFTAGVSGATSASLTSNGTGTFSQSVISGQQTVSYQPSLADATAGSVTLTLTSADPDGVGQCQRDQISRVLTINPTPVVVVPSVSVCAGETGELMASGASTYLWSNGATTGSISVSVAGPYSVTGTTAQGCSATASGTLTVYPALTLSPASLPAGVVGVAYSQTITASGGVPAYTFSSLGSLPNGLNLGTSTGVLSGTPTSAAPASFTVRVTDSKSCSAALPYTIGVVTASLGDYVFEDVNKDGLQDAGDLPISGAVVTLLLNGSAVAITTTSTSGLYSFTGLTPGVPYSVSFATPTGFSVSTSANVGSDDALDSDAINGLTGSYTLSAGENNRTIDAGFVRLAPPTPRLILAKLVSKGKAKLGEVISYTVVLINTGPVTATSVVVNDVFTRGLNLAPGSVLVSTGSFTPGLQGGTWAIANLPVGTTATLTYSASITAEGVIYNTATIPGTEVQVCTTVPFSVCKGRPFSIELGAASGYSRYQWYYTAPNSTSATLVADGTLDSFTATLAGEYQVTVDAGLGGPCARPTCCPILIEETEVPSYTALVKHPTCVGTTPQANGEITLMNLGVAPTAYVYQVSAGSSFSATTAVPAQPIPVPANGLISTGLAGGNYTVRVWVLIDGEPSCPRDVTVALVANCDCPEEICLPVIIRKTKSILR